MSLRYCAIASGSNGNCYFVANEQDSVLVDIGINTKHVEIRMARLGISPESVKGIFITHEHTDHVRGLSVFSKRYQIPVYLTEGTYKGTKLQLPEYLVNIIKADEKISVGTLQVVGVPKYHDAKDPCSFVVTDGKVNVAVLTDIGRGCANIKSVIQRSDVLMLESNYDEDMLKNGKYSYFLKNRITSGLGHISNKEALELLLENRTPRLKHLILTHLSGQNNTVDIVEKTFQPLSEFISVSIATRTEETALFLYNKEEYNLSSLV